MKFIVFSFFFVTFQISVFAEAPYHSKASDIVHLEHPDHVPHHPRGKDPTDQGSHDGIVYPRKKVKKGLLEAV